MTLNELIEAHRATVDASVAIGQQLAPYYMADEHNPELEAKADICGRDENRAWQALLDHPVDTVADARRKAAYCRSAIIDPTNGCADIGIRVSALNDLMRLTSSFEA